MRLLCALVALVLLSPPVLAADWTPDNRLIVHEWGTFTNFSGADGIQLEFRPLVTSDLPQFVLDRPRQQAIFDATPPDNTIYFRGGKGVITGFQRMETPVMYFYTDRERVVDVSVAFPKGLLTEFYPPVRAFGPEFKADGPQPLENSFLRWGKVRLIPAAAATSEITDQLPKVEGDNHYAFARNTDSAIIRVGDTHSDANTYEKFLFYRGVGNFSLPVKVNALGGNRFVVQNTGPDTIRAAFLVQVDAGQLRFVEVDGLAKQSDLVLPATASNPDGLAKAMVKALVFQGLFDKEASAMVHTWQSSWLGEEGTRLLYLVPPALTDEILPLKIDPKPEVTVRLLVGRMELLTPEREQEIGRLVEKLGTGELADRETATKALEKMGRFAEPALVRIMQVTQDDDVRSRASQLLEKIKGSR